MILKFGRHADTDGIRRVLNDFGVGSLLLAGLVVVVDVFVFLAVQLIAGLEAVDGYAFEVKLTRLPYFWPSVVIAGGLVALGQLCLTVSFQLREAGSDHPDELCECHRAAMRANALAAGSGLAVPMRCQGNCLEAELKEFFTALDRPDRDIEAGPS